MHVSDTTQPNPLFLKFSKWSAHSTIVVCATSPTGTSAKVVTTGASRRGAGGVGVGEPIIIYKYKI